MSERKKIEAWAERLERVMRDAPKGCWLYIANGTAHVMQLGAEGDRIKTRDGITFSQDAIVYTLLQIPIEMDGGDW